MRRDRLAWWIATTVVLVAVAAVGYAVTAGTGGGRGAQSSPSASAPHPSPSTSQCNLRVLETGFTNRYGKYFVPETSPAQGQIVFGFILENPCPQAATHIRLKPRLFNADGTPTMYASGKDSPGQTRTLSALLPGQRIGLGDIVLNNNESNVRDSVYDATKVARVEIVIRDLVWQPVADVPPSPTATFTNITVETKDAARGLAQVRYTFSVQPPTLLGIKAELAMIGRDAGGRIVFGYLPSLYTDRGVTASGGTGSSDMWIPPGVPGLHLEIYLVPGEF
jgi:hypothetical protein